MEKASSLLRKNIARLAWGLVSSICTTRGCQMVYRSADGLLGLHITSSGRKADRRRYFIWHLPDSAPAYATESEARAALAAKETQP
jgi:hypothetical protein